MATEEIKSIADFVVVLSEALAQLVMKQVVQRKKLLGEIAAAGQVVHKFSDNVVGARMSAGVLAVGDELVVVQKHACYKAIVMSIEYQQAPLERIETQDGQEIGIKLSVAVSDAAQLLKLPSVQPALPLEAVELLSPDDFPEVSDPQAEPNPNPESV